MITIQSTEARQHFGKYLTHAVKEPVIITRPNQEPIVLISKKTFDFLETLEDSFWYAKAMEASKEGYATQDEVDKLFERYFNEEHENKQAEHKISKSIECKAIQANI